MRTLSTVGARVKGRDGLIIAAAAGIVIGAVLLPSSGAGPHVSTGLPGGHRNPVPIRTSPPATPDPLANASGWSVTAIGDSLTVTSTSALKAALPGIFIFARVGRQFSRGLEVVAALKAQQSLRPIVVYALGTNGAVTASEVRALVRAVGPVRRLVLVNTFDPRPWEPGVNATLAAAAREYPNVVLANWYGAIRKRTYLLAGDGIHPDQAGDRIWVRVVKAAVERAASLIG